MRPTLLLVPLSLALATAALDAQAVRRPAPSTRATAEVTLAYPQGQAPAGATPAVIRVDYGQPHLRGRALFTDSLVPYDKPWRTGANAATTLRTDVALELGGATLPAATYVLYTLPSRAGWKLIVQRSAGQTADYDPQHDVARVDLRQRTLASPLESFSIWLVPSTQPGASRGELRLAWGTTELTTDWTVK